VGALRNALARLTWPEGALLATILGVVAGAMYLFATRAPEHWLHP
jgi:hypothetical protein